MPKRRRRVGKKARAFQNDVNTSVVEDDVDKMSRDAFLRDFDLQVQMMVSTMESDISKLSSYLARIMTSYSVSLAETTKKMLLVDFISNGGDLETLTMTEVGEQAESLLTKRLPLAEKTNNPAETPQLPQNGRSKRKAATKAMTAIAATGRVTRSKMRSQVKSENVPNLELMTPVCNSRNMPPPASTARKAKQGEILFSHNQSPVESAETPSVRPDLQYLKQVVDCNSPQFISKIQRLIDEKMKTVVEATSNVKRK